MASLSASSRLIPTREHYRTSVRIPTSEHSISHSSRKICSPPQTSGAVTGLDVNDGMSAVVSSLSELDANDGDARNAHEPPVPVDNLDVPARAEFFADQAGRIRTGRRGDRVPAVDVARHGCTTVTTHQFTRTSG